MNYSPIEISYKDCFVYSTSESFSVLSIENINKNLLVKWLMQKSLDTAGIIIYITMVCIVKDIVKQVFLSSVSLSSKLIKRKGEVVGISIL